CGNVSTGAVYLVCTRQRWRSRPCEWPAFSFGDQAGPASTQDMRRSTLDILLCWLTASTVNGIPSTVYALASGGDVLEATRAAGTMLISSDAPTGHLIAAAVLVHGTVSLFWATIVTLVLPRRNVVQYALVVATAIGVF